MERALAFLLFLLSFFASGGEAVMTVEYANEERGILYCQPTVQPYEEWREAQD